MFVLLSLVVINLVMTVFVMVDRHTHKCTDIVTYRLYRPRGQLGVKC